MKRLILNHHFLSPETSMVLLSVIFFFSLGNVLGQEKSKKKDKLFDVKIGLATFYDDNILKYSEKYLDRFMNGEDEGRFHIETYDDVILKPSLQIGATYQIFKKQKSRISFSYNYNGYVVNEIKNWQFMSLAFQQSFHKKASFRISYSYVPEFYVRHFRDEDLVNYYKQVYGFGYVPETFVPFSFAKDNYTLWIQNTFFKNTRIRLSVDYARYYHNPHYTEYDCKNWMYGILINQAITKKIRIEAGYEFTTSDANAYDLTYPDGNYDPDETKANSDDADATNEEDGFFISCSWQIPEVLKHKHSFEAGLAYEKRYYTTDHYVEEDPEHAGRVDKNLSYNFTYDFELSKSFDISAFYRWMGRDSGSSSWNDQYLTDEKDYRQGQVGIEVTYSLKF